MPYWSITSVVYPDMNTTFVSLRVPLSRSASSGPFNPGMTTSASRPWIGPA